MSAPETNARPPAPVTTTTRTESSAANSSRIWPSPPHISTDTALCFEGWLKVTTPTASRLAASILPPAYSRDEPSASVELCCMPTIVSRSEEHTSELQSH